MLSEPQLFEKVMFDIKRLSPEKRLLIIKLTSETLLPNNVKQSESEMVTTSQNNPIRFGEYRGTSFTDLEDFKITEWQPTDEYLNSF